MNDWEMEALERQYEQYLRDQQRALLARVTTDAEDAAAFADCTLMARQAEENEEYKLRCISGEKVFFYEYPKPLVPGHIYSKTGMDEYFISSSCEYHFDEWTKEPEEDDGLE